MLTLIAANFVVNMVFVVVSRTALLTLPVMIAVFAMVHLKWRTNVALFVFAFICLHIKCAGLDGVASSAGDDGQVRAGLPGP